MSSVLEDICKNYDSKVIRTKVGFKYLAPLLENNEVFFAGEESGGYSLRGHLFDKDGILSSLLYLEYLIKTKSTPKSLLQTLYEKYKKRFFERLDIEFLQDKREDIKDKIGLLETFLPEHKEITKSDSTDGEKIFFEDGSWILVRLSGTEPMFRVYIETNSKEDLVELKELISEYFKN